ncbi:MAG: hypothetical protein JOZ24_05035, partial [Candidatus Eremiobacteraeota bacterium]|nr:hypothetical protein [Candidatus Eremiobacteraeota bacterium]
MKSTSFSLIARLGLVLSLMSGALGPAAAAAPPSDAPPAANAAATALAADTPSATPSGATFTAPKSWSLRRATSMVVITAPEADFSVALVDAGSAADAAAAAARAW